MNFKKLFSIFRSPSTDGIRVVSTTPVVLEYRHGTSLETLLVPQQGVLIERFLDGSRSSLKVQFGKDNRRTRPSDGEDAYQSRHPFEHDSWHRQPGSEQACTEEYEALVRGLAVRSCSRRRTFGIAAFTAVVVAVLVSGNGAAPAASTAAAQLPSPVAALTAPVASAASNSKLDLNEMADIQTGHGITMHKDGKKFSVFTDPNCPYCRELEISLNKLTPALSPVVYPLGFKPGSRELSASILCSKDPAAAWKKSMLEGVAPTAPACEEGLRKVDANTALFTRLKLTSTPTMVSPSGQLVVGTGAPEQIAEVMGR